MSTVQEKRKLEKQIGTLDGSPVVEKHYRSILKTISWRITGTLDTMVVSYIITGSFAMAASIGFFEVFTKMALYYLHERIWSRLKVGLVVKQPPDYSI
ncbi:MAG: hypothetical protein CMF59_14695 [Leptospiraceae bacterium]|nr:hypothetical protein [Leptospiraceae bacterium]|tara:strand:+ start:136 stop:429 length:294 start_codon:yes stop_codon:yes gene_type:complete